MRLTLVFLFLATAAFAQSNGPFSITSSVISNGGGRSVNGPFEVTGTIAQPLTQTSAGPPFQVNSGFWQPAFTPTAAGVTIAGSVRTSDGRGLSNATVIVVDQNGAVRSARTGTFGFYRIVGLTSGQTVTVTVTSRKFQFPTRVVVLADNLDAFDLTAVGDNLR